MNAYNKILLLSCCFISLLTLSGCGLKGELYQTPESIKGEGYIEDDAKQQAIKNSDTEQPIPTSNDEALDSDKTAVLPSVEPELN